MSVPLIQLHPGPPVSRALEGCYLEASLRPEGHDGPFVYANFVSSLDGRISVPDRHGRQKVPGGIANPRDWRLLQELAGRADLLLSSGRYLRELNAGTAQDVLPVGEAPEFADIRVWRKRAGLAPQPDVAVFSQSLDFPVPQRLLAQGRRLVVLTGPDADPQRRRRHEAAGVRVLAVGEQGPPRGTALRAALRGLGYHCVYAITGPYVMHTLLAADMVDSLFVTTVHRVLGGSPFTSLCEGALLPAAADFRLRWLYHDTAGPGGCSQGFARYDRLASGP